MTSLHFIRLDILLGFCAAAARAGFHVFQQGDERQFCRPRAISQLLGFPQGTQRAWPLWAAPPLPPPPLSPLSLFF